MHIEIYIYIYITKEKTGIDSIEVKNGRVKYFYRVDINQTSWLLNIQLFADIHALHFLASFFFFFIDVTFKM